MKLTIDSLIDLAKKSNLKVGKIYTEYFEVLCPYHDDTNFGNSFIHINGYFKCFACGKKVSLQTLFHNKPTTKLYDFPSPITKKSKSFRKINFITLPLIIENFEYCLARGWTYNFVNFFNIKKCIYPYKDYCIIPITKIGNIFEIYELRLLINDENKPKTIYQKGLNVKNYLFNYENLDLNKPLYIKEGVSGIAKIWNFISRNVTATFGNQVSNFQLKLLDKFNHLVIIPDLDLGGIIFLSKFKQFFGNKKIEIILAEDDNKKEHLDSLFWKDRKFDNPTLALENLIQRINQKT